MKLLQKVSRFVLFNDFRLGWHSFGDGEDENFTTTMGNNVIAHENFDGSYNNDPEKNYRPDGGKNLVFDFPLNLKDEPRKYIDAAVTNLFYWNNVMHDLFYMYGFTEETGNFQHSNFDNGGKGINFR